MKTLTCALSVVIFCVIAPLPAYAGAWLRDVGTGFVSATATIRNLDGTWQSENSLYAEYGLAPRLTLGLDLNEVRGVGGHVLVFARLPVAATHRRTKISLELGLGGHSRQGQWEGMARSTLSVGRGFSSRWGDGWFNVDAGVELRRPNPDPAFKLDATIGLSSGGRIRPLLQFESTYALGRALTWSIIPGVLIDGRENTTWQIGVARKTAGQTSLGLKIGLWRQF